MYRFLVLALAVSCYPAVSQTGDKTPAPPSLTDAQKKAIEAAHKLSESQLLPIVLRLALVMKEYDRNALSDTPDPEVDRQLEQEAAQTLTQVIVQVVHQRAQAIHEVVKTLSPEQKKLLLEELDKPGSKPGLIELVEKMFAAKTD